MCCYSCGCKTKVTHWKGICVCQEIIFATLENYLTLPHFCSLLILIKIINVRRNTVHGGCCRMVPMVFWVNVVLLWVKAVSLEA